MSILIKHIVIKIPILKRYLLKFTVVKTYIYLPCYDNNTTFLTVKTQIYNHVGGGGGVGGGETIAY